MSAITIGRPSDIFSYQRCARYFMLSKTWEWGGPARPGLMELGTLTHHLLSATLMRQACSGTTKRFPDVDLTSISLAEIDPMWMSEEAQLHIERMYPEDQAAQTQAMIEHLPYAIAMCRSVIAYFERSDFFATWKIISIEKPYELNIGDRKLSCTPDMVLLHRVIGHGGILDYKTKGNLSAGLHVRDWQLNCYALAVEESTDMEVFHGQHLKIKRVKTTKNVKGPFVDPEEIRFSPTRLARARVELEALLERVENDKLWLPTPTGNCKSRRCQYLDACEAWDGSDDHEYVLRQTHVPIRSKSASSEEGTAADPAG